MTLLARLNIVALACAGASVLAMTLLGGADVIAAAGFGRPIPAVFESTAALMVIVVFLCLGHLQSTDGHVAIDALVNRLGPRGRRWQRVVSQALAAAFFGILAWQSLELAWQSWSIREYSMGLVPFPLYPGKFAVAAGAALTTLCCLDRLVDVVRGRETGAVAPVPGA